MAVVPSPCMLQHGSTAASALTIRGDLGDDADVATVWEWSGAGIHGHAVAPAAAGLRAAAGSAVLGFGVFLRIALIVFARLGATSDHFVDGLANGDGSTLHDLSVAPLTSRRARWGP